MLARGPPKAVVVPEAGPMNVVAAIVATSTWLWPVTGPVESAFEAPTHAYAAGHRGLDIAVRPGTPTRAAHAGVVTHAGLVAGVPTLTVRQGSTLTTYQPLVAAVTTGTRVGIGDLLGHVGRWPGHCTCLHLGVRVDGEYRDPLDFLRVPIVIKSPRRA